MRYQTAIGLVNEIEQIFGTKSHFFLEPSAFIACRKDQDLVPKVRELNSASPIIKWIFEEVFACGVKGFFGGRKFRSNSLISCGQELQMFPLFIDESHFTPQFSNFLSEKITDRLFQR